MNEVKIIPYSPALAHHFERINTEWLERYFYVEPIDKEVLGKPDQYIVGPGGTIIFAAIGEEIVGTVALMPAGPGVYEMTKMGVSPEHQGKKVGVLLAREILHLAEKMGAEKVILYSSTKLSPAINLYRKLGFTEIYCEPGHYQRSDIKMELPMDKSLNKDQRNEMLESYGKAYDKIVEALKTFPKEMWQWKPAPHKWSIHEQIIHLADSEANSFVRCRRFIAEPGSGVMAYDQDTWARKCDYHSQSAEDALELFRLLRKMSYDLLKIQTEGVWSNTIEHPENGTMTFTDWLRVYENHTHINQMNRVYTAWKTFQETGKLIYA